MDSHENSQLELKLKPAPDDPAVRDPAFQSGLQTFSRALHAADVRFLLRAKTFDSVDSTGYALGEYVIRELGPAAIAVIGAAVGAWLNGHAGRKVRLKVGDIEAEARTIEEVEQLLQRAEALQVRQGENQNEA